MPSMRFCHSNFKCVRWLSQRHSSCKAVLKLVNNHVIIFKFNVFENSVFPLCDDIFNSGLLQDPINSGLLQDRINSGLLQDPINRCLLQDPINSGLLQNPINSGLLQDPISSGLDPARSH